jgi:hypothetical protein
MLLNVKLIWLCGCWDFDFFGGFMLNTYAIELDNLPDFAQVELWDFYQFLLQKYQATTKSKVAEDFIVPRLVEKFEPLSRAEANER